MRDFARMFASKRCSVVFDRSAAVASGSSMVLRILSDRTTPARIEVGAHLAEPIAVSRLFEVGFHRFRRVGIRIRPGFAELFGCPQTEYVLRRATALNSSIANFFRNLPDDFLCCPRLILRISFAGRRGPL